MPLNLLELQRYLGRIGERWPLSTVMIGGAQVDAYRGVPESSSDGPSFVVVLVAEAFSGMPWLERVHQATSLWDGLEMGAPADVHCYTPKEFARRRETTPAVATAVERGLLLFEDTGPLSPGPQATTDGPPGLS